MARATSSLPVPLSPVTSTVERWGATRWIVARSARMASLSPTRRDATAPPEVQARPAPSAAPGMAVADTSSTVTWGHEAGTIRPGRDLATLKVAGLEFG